MYCIYECISKKRQNLSESQNPYNDRTCIPYNRCKMPYLLVRELFQKIIKFPLRNNLKLQSGNFKKKLNS